MDRVEGIFRGYDGTELYSQYWRPGNRPKAALAVIHGYGEHSGRYDNVVNWFVPRGYAVHTFDMRGHGRSPGQRGHIDSYSEIRGDVRAFLDTMHREYTNGPIFLVGHSQGGLTALNYVLHDPSELAGVVVSGSLLSPLPVSSFLLFAAKILSIVVPRLPMKSRLDVTALSRDTAVVRDYVNDPLVHGEGTPRMATELIATIEWTHTHAADMSLPCLMVHGGADRLCPLQACQAFFEKMTFVDKELLVYDGYYHEVYNELGKEQVFADVESWLERHL
jgi:alpha-beta hydrolase superfamily lysophospholipase